MELLHHFLTAEMAPKDLVASDYCEREAFHPQTEEERFWDPGAL